MTLRRKVPIPRKRAKPRLGQSDRRWKSPRCDVRGCTKPQDVRWGEVEFGPIANATGALVYGFGLCCSHATAEADRRFSLFIRERDGECRIRTEKPCVGPLSCCHLLSRRFRSTRWDEGNALSGCAGHHAYWTVNADRWAAWLDNHNTVELARLRTAAFHGDPPDLADVLERYSKYAKEKDE